LTPASSPHVATDYVMVKLLNDISKSSMKTTNIVQNVTLMHGHEALLTDPPRILKKSDPTRSIATIRPTEYIPCNIFTYHIRVTVSVTDCSEI